MEVACPSELLITTCQALHPGIIFQKQNYLQGHVYTLVISALAVTKLRIQSLSAFRYSG